MLIGILARRIGLIGSKVMAKKIGDKPVFSPISMFCGLFLWAWLMLSLSCFGAAALVALVGTSETGCRTEMVQGSWGKIGTRELPGISGLHIFFNQFFLLIVVPCFVSKSAMGLRIGRHAETGRSTICGIPMNSCRQHYIRLGSGLACSRCAIRCLGFGLVPTSYVLYRFLFQW